jgi:hypothetical protein
LKTGIVGYSTLAAPEPPRYIRGIGKLILYL